MKKYLVIIIAIVAILMLYLYLGKLFSPGSYPNAEKYELNISEPELVSRIKKFKAQNHEFNVPDQLGLVDGRAHDADHWYHVYFYYAEENQVIYSWVRSDGEQKSVLALVAVNDGLELGKWKDVNKDLSSVENAQHKQKFEARILDKLR